MEKYVMTVEDVQKALYIGKDKAYRLFKQKSFPSFQIEGRYYVTVEDFGIWLGKLKKLPDKSFRMGLMMYGQEAYYGC